MEEGFSCLGVLAHKFFQVCPAQESCFSLNVDAIYHENPALLKAQLYGQQFRTTCRATMLPLQVGIVCCAYYHLLAQQIFMLQQVDVAFTFCSMKICCAGWW